MKKVLFSALVLVLLTGCYADGNATLSSDETLFTVGSQTVKRSNLFEVMKRTDAGQVVLQNAQLQLVSSIETTDAITQEAEESWQTLVTAYGDEETLLAILVQNGIDSKDVYMNDYVIPELKMVQLLRDSMNTDFDTLVTTYSPRKVRILQVADETSGNEALTKLRAGESFDSIASEYQGASTTYVGAETVYMASLETSTPSSVSGFIANATTPTLSDLLSTEGVDGYYIVQVVEVDATRFKDDVIEKLIDTSTVVNEYLAKVFRDNNFTLYDEVIYDAIYESYPTYLEES